MKAVLSLACVLLFAVSASAETRTWKDKSGKFSIQAELVESDGTAVTLKKADGKVIKVPVDRFERRGPAVPRIAGEERFQRYRSLEESGCPRRRASLRLEGRAELCV